MMIFKSLRWGIPAVLLFQSGLGAQSQSDMSGMDSMSMPMILGEPEGSGTSWLPESSPAHQYAYHFMAGDWNLMAHGEVFARYTRQNANNTDKWPPGASGTAGQSFYPSLERGDDRTDFPNWAMLAANRSIFANDRILFRAMLSLDPLTEGREGYPLLFQAGEGLVDRQHAHDLFMELAAMYSHGFGDADRAYAYFGLPGEPALGPVAFMHRPAGWNNPDAPLAHHTEDATHITYGVATLGWIHGKLKTEASIFRGQEPDKNRWDIEAPSFDSYSLRLAGNPSKTVSLQASGGYLQNTEPDVPGVDVFRGTASMDHSLVLSDGANWSSSAIYGFNVYVHGPHRGITHSGTLETNREFKQAALWARWESVERLSAELDIPGPENRFMWVHALTAGAGWTPVRFAGMELMLGAQATANAMDSELEPYYGTWPVSWELFLRIRPSGKKAEHMSHGGDEMGPMDMHGHGM